MPFDNTTETATTRGLSLEEMERIGKEAEKIRQAMAKLREAESRLELLKKHTAEDADYSVKTSWNPTLILKKGGNYDKDVTIKVRLPFGVVQQQLVDDIKRARREVVRLGGVA